MAKLVLPRLLAFPLLAFVGQWFWIRNYAPTSVAASAFWIPVLTYCWFCVGGLSHELIHQNLPLGPRASRLIGRILGTFMGIPYTVYKEVHMRHHAYLNTPLDWELWPYCDPSASLRFRRIFVWFDMLFGSLSTPLIWSRVCFSSRSPVSERVRKVMRMEYLVILLTAVTIASIGIWLVASGRQQWRWELLIYALPPVLAASCNSVRKLTEHIGMASYDPIHGTRTVIGRSIITRLLSYFDFDLAVHGPHHRFPKLDHTQLQGKMAEIQETAPNKSFPVFSSFTSALVHTFRTVIINPGVGVNAGCTDDLSHLPGMKDAPASQDGQHFAFAGRS